MAKMTLQVVLIVTAGAIAAIVVLYIIVCIIIDIYRWKDLQRRLKKDRERTNVNILNMFTYYPRYELRVRKNE